MTTRTAERKSKKSLADRIELLVDGVKLKLFLVPLGEHLWTERQESGCDQLFTMLPVAFITHQITGDLFAYKLIVRTIAIEGIDDIVAIPPCLIKRVIAVAPFESA